MDLRGRVGARVKQLRQARRLTQEQLAEQSGLSYKFVGEIERGRGNPTLTTLSAISEALGVSLPQLLAVIPDRPRLTQRQVAVVRDAISVIEPLLAETEPAAEPSRRPKRRPKS